MIGITKPARPPEILVRETTRQRIAECCEQFGLSADDYRAGRRKFTFSDSIYNHEMVKEALILAQHGKCCFCEMKIADEGDVEHFRPKSGYRQRAGDRLGRPGYYWLAYEWSNLLLACSSCNQRFKRNFFPLADPSQRAESHATDINLAEPLLINPAALNPEEYISFRAEVPHAIENHPYGVATIQILGLKRRRNLHDRRREHLNDLLMFWKLVALESTHSDDPELQQLITQAKVRLAQATSEEAEFAAASRAAIQSDFRYVLDA